MNFSVQPPAVFNLKERRGRNSLPQGRCVKNAPWCLLLVESMDVILFELQLWLRKPCWKWFRGLCSMFCFFCFFLVVREFKKQQIIWTPFGKAATGQKEEKGGAAEMLQCGVEHENVRDYHQPRQLNHGILTNSPCLFSLLLIKCAGSISTWAVTTRPKEASVLASRSNWPWKGKSSRVFSAWFHSVLFPHSQRDRNCQDFVSIRPKLSRFHFNPSKFSATMAVSV